MPARTTLIKIASYRDRELIITMASALQNAARPDDIHFAIVNQFDDATVRVLDPARADPRMRIREIPWQDSRGLGRARRLSDEMYDGEDFTLQTDAHMRFAPGWDDDLIRQWDHVDNPRAVLSCYPGPYRTSQGDDVIANPAVPHTIVVQGVDAFGLPSITGGSEVTPFTPTLLVSGGFQFAAGEITTALPAQPEVLIGDESVHALRLFTSGYDVVVPDNVPLYHRYADQKDFTKDAHRPFSDFRAIPSLWESFSAALDEGIATAKAILGTDGHPALGSVRPRGAFFDGLDAFRKPGVPVPRYEGITASER